jgi:hypothetical protein
VLCGRNDGGRSRGVGLENKILKRRARRGLLRRAQRKPSSSFRAQSFCTWEMKETKVLGKMVKGRDIGYALAAASCEGANSVDACTVTAP